MIKDESLNIKKMIVVTVIAIVVLGLTIYAAYLYSVRQSSNIILPGGITYLGPTTSPIVEEITKETVPKFSAASDVAWKTWVGRIYPYEFSYPETLPLVIFPGDQTDSVAIAWNNIDPRVNILINMEFMQKRDPQMKGKPAIEFVQNWYKYFSGLQGVASIEKITTVTGLKGYKAKYINAAGQTPNTDVFYEIPAKPNMLLRLASGILSEEIFNRMADSIRWNPPVPTTANK